MRLLNGKQLNIIELPMPEKLIYDDQRLPCSYANFYIANKSVIVPVFQSDRDEKALQIIQDSFRIKMLLVLIPWILFGD